MNIGFVAEPYEETGASGMGYLVRELVRNLPPAGSRHFFTIYSSKPIPQDFVAVPFKNVIVPRSLVGKLWWFARTKEDIDTLLFITPLLPLLLPKRIRAVPICPELVSQKITPGSLKEKVIAVVRDKILLPQCFKRATHFITISYATEKDMARYYRIPAERILVQYIGFQNLSVYPDSGAPEEARGMPYFFFTGRAKPRKNVHGIVEAFVQLKKRAKIDCKLIIAGKANGAYRDQLEKIPKEGGVEADVVFVGYVSPEQLATFYRHALALVFPSFNEGFGLPVAEAMSLGTPVITSSISSLPEVAGDAGILVDPHDVGAISTAMEKIFFDAGIREVLSEKGRVQAQKFSWEVAAKGYVTLLDRLSSGR
jgi:glycosyltransferase involved in cell wall biosynthesis